MNGATKILQYRLHLFGATLGVIVVLVVMMDVCLWTFFHSCTSGLLVSLPISNPPTIYMAPLLQFPRPSKSDRYVNTKQLETVKYFRKWGKSSSTSQFQNAVIYCETGQVQMRRIFPFNKIILTWVTWKKTCKQ